MVWGTRVTEHSTLTTWLSVLSWEFINLDSRGVLYKNDETEPRCGIRPGLE